MGQWRSKALPPVNPVVEQVEDVENVPSEEAPMSSVRSSSSEPSLRASVKSSRQPSASVHEEIEEEGEVDEEEVEEEEEEEIIAPPSVKVVIAPKILKKVETLSSYEEILESEAAHSLIKAALLKNPPGSLDRWDKIVQYINAIRPPSEEDPAPLLVSLTLSDLRRLLSAFFGSVGDALESEEFVLMKSIMERLYDKVRRWSAPPP